MTVKDLRKMLKGLPSDMEVMIPINPMDGFDGMFFSPCNEESGEAEFGFNPEDADKDDVEELINPSGKEKSFVLVPCGFFSLEEEEDFINPELN